MIKIKKIIKSLLPAGLTAYLQKKRNLYGYFGNYDTWDEALKKCTGYSNQVILDKTKESALKVKNGEAKYERDSVVFNEIQYAWPVLASFFWIASQNNNQLRLVDIGGSLGTSYYQNFNFLKNLSELNWNIIEQPSYVELGLKLFANKHLNFYSDLNICLKKVNPQVALLSSSLQYLKNPYAILDELIKSQVTYLIFDRTNFINEENDRLTIQKVPPRIYDASYPSWFFSETKFTNYLLNDFELITEFNSLNKKVPLDTDNGYEKGFLFKRKLL